MTSSYDHHGDRSLPSQETMRLWLDLEADGELPAADAMRLEAALRERPELQQERRELARLHEVLRRSRFPVRAGFREAVMSGLPPASWEPVAKQAWGAAIAAAALLAVVSGMLLTLGEASPTGSGFGVLTAIAELLKASVVTGAGLLGASWRGLALALQQALDASPLTMAAFGIGVLAVNLLFLRLLRRSSQRTRLALDRAGVNEDPPRD